MSGFGVRREPYAKRRRPRFDVTGVQTRGTFQVRSLLVRSQGGAVLTPSQISEVDAYVGTL